MTVRRCRFANGCLRPRIWLFWDSKVQTVSVLFRLRWELANVRCFAEQLIDAGSNSLHLFESDVTAIRAFIRELVAQSVIPNMENRVAVWNDQVASKRRGLSGRFMSMSRRWAGFGSSSRPGSVSSGSGGNYDPVRGFYKTDSPESLLRKMADYAFMLRDWKLAASTYDLLRSDYENDKAWKYHAGAHEMCAVSTLLNPLSSTSKTKLEPIDQLLDTACYSYLTRCSDALHGLRTLILGVELLKSRGGHAADSAAKWSIRILETNLVGNVGRVLVSERVSACFASKVGTNGTKWGTRRRKAGLWALIAADSWLKLGKPQVASLCLEEADRQYGEVLDEGAFTLPEMQQFVDDLRHAVKIEYLESQGVNGEKAEEEEEQEKEGSDKTQLETTEESSEKLDNRSHRKSLMGGANPLETIPSRNSALLKSHDARDSSPNDDFE